jgi:hypothetical protein
MQPEPASGYGVFELLSEARVALVSFPMRYAIDGDILTFGLTYPDQAAYARATGIPVAACLRDQFNAPIVEWSGIGLRGEAGHFLSIREDKIVVHGIVEFSPSDTITLNLAEHRAAVKASKIELHLGEAVAFVGAADLVRQLPGGVATALAEGGRVISTWPMIEGRLGEPGNIHRADDGRVSVLASLDLALRHDGPALVMFGGADGATLAAAVIEVDGTANRARLAEAEASGKPLRDPPVCMPIVIFEP